MFSWYPGYFGDSRVLDDFFECLMIYAHCGPTKKTLL